MPKACLSKTDQTADQHRDKGYNRITDAEDDRIEDSMSHAFLDM